MSDHFCGVCGIVSTLHPEPFWSMEKFFINPCCKGCRCGTYEEYLDHASATEKKYEAEHR